MRRGRSCVRGANEETLRAFSRKSRAYGGALAAGGVLFTCYVATLAPGVTLWDSGEFIASAHGLGIPHPPGTPMYVLVANVWASILEPVAGFAYAVNLLSAASTAAACTILAALIGRWTGSPLAAFSGAVCAGAMSSVWHNANETEVYAVAFFVTIALLWIGNQARETREARWLVLVAYVVGLGWTVHLSALIALPAALYLAYPALVPARAHVRRYLACLLAATLGASALLFLLVRARHDPFVNQGNPATLQALWEVVTRRQYMPAGFFPRQAPWFIQIGNLFEYADWQVAWGLWPHVEPALRRTPLTLVYAMLGGVGSLFHRARHRVSWRAMGILFLTASLGTVLYLNLKAGPSFGEGFLPPGAPREARERDYFFAVAFACWGMWAGIGAVGLCASLRRRVHAATERSPHAPYIAAAAATAMLPLALNWTAVDRSSGPDATAARDHAVELLRRAPANAVILARADNDTYPVWYLQQVESVRRDVTVVVVPMLPAKWYRGELARRYGLMDEPSGRWRGEGIEVATVRSRAAALGRPVIEAASLAKLRRAER